MNIFKFKQSLAKGFTLVELLVVISIITFLTSVVIASVRSSRERAKDAKIAEDLRQVRTAAELYYTDKQSYKFTTFDNINKDILVDNDDMPTLKDFNPFSIKTANADWPTACTVFNNIAGNLVALKYLAVMPVHPRQNEADGICYKAATTTDGSYFVAYGQISPTVIVDGVSRQKNTGFIAGDTDLPTLNAIYDATGKEFPAIGTTAGSIVNISDIVDQIQGVTNGSGGGSGGGGGDSSPSTYTLTINPNGMTSFFIDNVETTDLSPKTYPNGTEVHLLAYKDSTPAESWDENSGCFWSSGSACWIIMDTNRSVTPVFPTASTYNMVINVQLPDGASYSGTVTGGNSNPYTAGTVVQLTASPSRGAFFGGWGGDASSCGTNLNCSVTMNSNKTVTATFSMPRVISTTILSSPGASGSVEGVNLGGYAIGATANLTAVPGDYIYAGMPNKSKLTASAYIASVGPPKSSFLGWGGDASSCGTDLNCSLIMNTSKAITASFGDPTY